MPRFLLLAPLLTLPALWRQDPGAASSDPFGRPAVRIGVEFMVAAPNATEFEAVFQPDLLTLEGVQASVSVENQKAYVSHFEVEYSNDGGSAIADPVVETLRDGCELTITPHRDPAGHWGGALMFQEGRINSLQDVDVRLGSTAVTLQMPDAELRSRYLPLTPRADGLWLVDLGPDPDGQRRMLRVKMHEVAEPAPPK
ncbi:MAG: hypothetical protein EYC70_02550 [Planctomycetota bacterium]|nr:MAG: hypothetical protein EYC70_02550 [Planctomycetota bacterium]